jgi:tRNA U34 5-carboxymethylaminomethyl modifying enzyme MnmG/GidA
LTPDIREACAILSGLTSANFSINKSLQQVEKVKRMEEKKIPEDLDYSKVDSLATEAREKLAEVKHV